MINGKKIYAHRGNIDRWERSEPHPEDNTIEAFENAIQHDGIDGIEFDVDQTQEECLVVCHRLKKERKNLPCNHLMENHPKIREFGTAIESIKHYLARYNKTKQVELNIEVKKYKHINYHSNYEERILKLLTATFNEDQYSITSFSPEALAKLKKAAQKLKRQINFGILMNKEKYMSYETEGDFIVSKFSLLNSHENFFEYSGKDIWVYGVNKKNKDKAFKHNKISVIILDEAKKILEP